MTLSAASGDHEDAEMLRLARVEQALIKVDRNVETLAIGMWMAIWRGILFVFGSMTFGFLLIAWFPHNLSLNLYIGIYGACLLIGLVGYVRQNLRLRRLRQKQKAAPDTAPMATPSRQSGQ